MGAEYGTSHPAAGLARLPLLPGAREAIAERALTHKAPVDVGTGVVARVIAAARRNPGRAAVLDSSGALGYGDLLRRVDHIRSALLESGVAPGDGVAVAGPRSAETIAAFLALESLGAVYLPLDVGWPAPRLVGVLRGSGVRCLVHIAAARSDRASEKTAAMDRAAQRAGIPLLALTRGQGTGPDPTPPWAPHEAGPDEPRYVIHTSGSTGRPKGALVDHRGMMNHLWYMVENLRLTEHDRIGFTAPPSYVISVWQMLAALLVGGTVVVVDDKDLLFPRRLLEAAVRSRLTVMELVPSAIRPLTDLVERTAQAIGAGADLRCLISTGEVLDPHLAARALKAFDGVMLVNAYGSTECSDDVTHHVVRPEDLGGRLPLGRPIANASLYLLVEEEGGWRAAEDGEIGELWVGGTPVGLGYLHEPGLTRDRFFADDIDAQSASGRLYRTGDLARRDAGHLYCLGRADRQVKIAGARIELGAVEAELARHPAVRMCAVTVAGDESHPKVTAHYVADEATTWRELQEFLRSSIPEVMVPRRWKRLEALPLNGSGKVDYRSLEGSE